MMDSNRSGYFWLGVSLGAVATALYAPRSGAETRKYCHTKIQETADMLIRQAEDLRDRAAKTVERGNQGFEHQLRKVSAAIEAGTRTLRRAS
jgi:gas vesicle protein